MHFHSKHEEKSDLLNVSTDREIIGGLLKGLSPNVITTINIVVISFIVFFMFVALILLIEKVFIKNFISNTLFLLELSSFPIFCFVAMLPLGFIPIFYLDYRNIAASFEIAYHIVFYILVTANFIIILDYNSYLTFFSCSKLILYSILFAVSGSLYLISIWFISNQSEYDTLKKCKVIYLAISYIMGVYNAFYLSYYILTEVRY